jgi:hypothetical protein
MRPIVNPFMPTPLGLAYYLPNPFTGQAVEFDDCEQKTGTMIDYKDQYWELLTSGIGAIIVDKLRKQALDQISAAGSRAIRWYFAEKEAADFVRDLFRNDPNIRGRILIEDRLFLGSRR